jgi:hypothetical protein
MACDASHGMYTYLKAVLVLVWMMLYAFSTVVFPSVVVAAIWNEF